MSKTRQVLLQLRGVPDLLTVDTACVEISVDFIHTMQKSAIQCSIMRQPGHFLYLACADYSPRVFRLDETVGLEKVLNEQQAATIAEELAERQASVIPEGIDLIKVLDDRADDVEPRIDLSRLLIYPDMCFWELDFKYGGECSTASLGYKEALRWLGAGPITSV